MLLKEYFQPVVFKPPKWLIMLSWLAALSAKGSMRTGATGRAMILSSSEYGILSIRFKNGSTKVYQGESAMKHRIRSTCFIFIITAVFLISGHDTVFAVEGCDNAETIDPDSVAGQKAIDDYAWVSGLQAGWKTAGYEQDTKSWVDDVGDIVDGIRNPLEKAVEKGMSKMVSYHTDSRLKMLYEAYKQKMASQEASAGNKPAITTDYDKQVGLEIEAIKDFARAAGCPPDLNFWRANSKENNFFSAWIQERYRKEKEATEILKKAKELDIPINVLSSKRAEVELPGAVFGNYWTGKYENKISKNPYTSLNRAGQMDWNYDILRYSITKYNHFEKTLEGRLDEIFEQNDMPKNLLKQCYTQARDTVKKDFMKKTYELLCKGKEAEIREYLNKETSEDICKFLPGCLPTDYKNKKLDCQKKKAPETKTDTKTNTKSKDPDKKDQSAAPKEKTDLFGDLCRCSCNSGVGGGSGYDPAWGCVCTGVLGGKWPAPMVSSGECSISATQAAGLEPGSLGETIKNMNKGWGEKFLQMAKDLIEDIWTPLPGLSLGKTGKTGTPETLKERVERKLNEGDLDTAEGHAKTAVIMYPPLESAAKAVIPGTLPWRMDKLAISFVPSLDFSTSRRILERTIKLDEKNQQLNKSLTHVVQWEKEWNQIKSLSEDCFSLIKSKRVCECQRLFDGKIEPLNNSFRIFTGGGEQKVLLKDGISSITELNYLPIPEKYALRGKLLLQLENSRRVCRYQPGLAETVGRLESYTLNRAGPGLSDQAIADMAVSVLERKGLCDCERELAEQALSTAKKWIAEQKPPAGTPKPAKLDVSLMADKNMLKVGESAYIAAAVTGGKPPYKIKWGGALSGEGTTFLFKAQKSGSNIIYAEATDPAGNKGSASITISVEAEKISVKEPSHDGTTKKAPSSKIGKSKIIVLGSKPETSISPLKLKVPQGEQSQTLLFTYEHKSIETGKMIYIMEAPSATTFIIEPSNSGASIVRISNPAKWGEEKFFAVDIDKDVKPGKKFTVTAYYSGVPNPQWISNKYLDTGEDAEEYKKKNVKPATAVIEVIGGKLTTGKTDTGYDPTNDISYTPGSKTIDTAQIDSLSKTFQDTHINIKKTDSTQGTQGPLTPQPPPPHPTDTATSKGSDDQNTAYPYPYAPPDRTLTNTWATDITNTKAPSHDTNIRKPQTSSGSQDGSQSEIGSSTQPTAKCDPSQKQAAYNEGYKCGQKAKKNNNKMTSDCLSIPQTYMNKDNKMGWGSCLYSGFDEGYRAGLGKTTGSPISSGSTVLAKITNRSKKAAHIFTDGETFGPGNRFAPGEKNREVNVKVPSNNKITFHAGRDGQVIASKSWYYDPAQPGRFPHVIFNDSMPKGYDKLIITTGLR